MQIHRATILSEVQTAVPAQPGGVESIDTMTFKHHSSSLLFVRPITIECAVDFSFHKWLL